MISGTIEDAVDLSRTCRDFYKYCQSSELESVPVRTLVVIDGKGEERCLEQYHSFL